jgi:hypothetical protein
MTNFGKLKESFRKRNVRAVGDTMLRWPPQSSPLGTSHLDPRNGILRCLPSITQREDTEVAELLAKMKSGGGN